LLFGSNTFVSIIVSVVLSVIIGAFIAIYRTEHIKKKKADKKNTTISKKGGANRKTKKANASSSSTSKTTKGKTKSILDRMFNKKLLPKLNSIPKADMEELIKKDPLPFGIAILFGFIQETENGYVFSKDGLDRLKTSIHNSMDTLYDVTKENMEDADASTHVEDEHDDDDEYISNKELDLVSDSLEAMKLVHTASIHALAREAVDESNRETTGGSTRGSPSRRIKIPKTVKLQKEDIQWLHKKFPKNFEKAKKFGLVDDNMNFTENADKIIENENTKTVVAQ
jgi:phosphate/sulfate permease